MSNHERRRWPVAMEQMPFLSWARVYRHAIKRLKRRDRIRLMLLRLGAHVILWSSFYFILRPASTAGIRIGGIILAGVSAGGWFWLERRILTNSARAAHVEDSVCPDCGYNLTGNVSGVCPECGAAIDGM